MRTYSRARLAWKISPRRRSRCSIRSIHGMGTLKCSTDVIAILVFSTVITTLAVVQSLLQYYGVDRFEESTNSFPVTFIPALRDGVLIRSLLRLSSTKDDWRFSSLVRYRIEASAIKDSRENDYSSKIRRVCHWYNVKQNSKRRIV